MQTPWESLGNQNFSCFHLGLNRLGQDWTGNGTLGDRYSGLVPLGHPKHPQADAYSALKPISEVGNSVRGVISQQNYPANILLPSKFKSDTMWQRYYLKKPPVVKNDQSWLHGKIQFCSLKNGHFAIILWSLIISKSPDQKCSSPPPENSNISLHRSYGNILQKRKIPLIFHTETAILNVLDNFFHINSK